MPKILRIVNRFNLGGPTFNTAYLTKYLNPDFETLLIGGSHTETEESSEHILNELDIEYTKIEEMSREISLLNDYKVYKKVKQIIKEYKPDIVHTHASKAGLIGRLAASHTGVKVIVHTFHGHIFHSYFGKLKTNIFINLEQYLAKKSTKIIAISNKQKSELVDTYKIAPENKFEIIPLGFDLSKFTQSNEINRKNFRNKYKVSGNEIIISIVGRLVPIKNHKLFIDGISEIAKSKKVRAFIVGGGELFDELNKYVINNNLENIIIFTSWIKETEQVYAGSDIVVLTSLNEGTPVSLIEAQASGLPVISTNAGGVKDITFENSSIIINNSAKELSNALAKMIENYDIYKRNAENNKTEILKKFGYSRLINDYKKLYLKLLNES